MNQEELENEVKSAVKFFRLTMGGGFKDFDTLEQLNEYMIKNWGNNYYASVKRLYEIPDKHAYKGK